MVRLITRILDFFYPLAKPFMNRQTYYYAACGGANTLLGFVIYYLCFHYFLHEENLDVGFYAMKPHIASFFISFIITFPIGFLLSKYIVWKESYLRGRQQLSRHILLVAVFVFMNYVLLKLFVEVFNWWPLPSQVLTTSIILVCSYLAQKYFSFK
ncbi:MAG: GtrA family protein [Bacteroidetes bacterium]|nr:MAG: GtrA family protein [Bacteroidota bacterium]